MSKEFRSMLRCFELIPVEGVDCHANDVAIESAKRDPRGLNLVSEGHYS